MSNIHIPNHGRTPVADYNEVNLLETDDSKVAKLEFWTAKQIGERLIEVYPNRQWSVQVDIPNQQAIISCPSLSLTHGYHIDLGLLTIKELKERAILAAGEILERYNLERSRVFDPSKFDTLERDPLTDEAVSPDAKGVNPLKVKHE